MVWKRAVVGSSSDSRMNSQSYSRSTKATTSQMADPLFDAAVSAAAARDLVPKAAASLDKWASSQCWASLNGFGSRGEVLMGDGEGPGPDDVSKQEHGPRNWSHCQTSGP